MTREGDKLNVTLDLQLDARSFKNMMQARNFLIQNQKGIENLINKLAIARTSISFVKITSKEQRAVADALKRLGLLPQG